MHCLGGKSSCCACIWLMLIWGICQAMPYIKGEDKQKSDDFPGSGDHLWIQTKMDGRNAPKERQKLAPTTTVKSADRMAGGKCGTMKIVSGLVAEDNWPWQAELYVKKTGRHLCGGTLVGNQHILTAAHCFDTFDKNEILVRLGSLNRTVQRARAQTYPISCLYLHKRYLKGANYDNDIALLKLKTAGGSESRSVALNDYVAPACLPGRREFEAGKQCVVTGWGYTDFRSLLLGRLPSQLREAKIPLISSKTCRDAYGFTLTNRMVCAGYMQGEQRADTCNGDSGGPLVCQSEDGRWKLWGVTSWGGNQFCSQSPTDPSPGVYTRVDKFVKWIDKKMSTEQCAV